MPDPTLTAVPSPELPTAAPDVALLKRNAVLSGLTEAELALLLSRMDVLTAAPGVEVVREGDEGAHMYFVLEGAAQLTRGHLEIGVVGAGEHFGELGFVGTRQRAATVSATEPLRLARFGREACARLAESHPHLVLDLYHGLMDALGLQLTHMTDSVGRLLVDRFLPRRTEVSVQLGEELRPVATGTTVRSLLPAKVNGVPVVAGLVDSRPVSLDTPVVSEVAVLPLTLADPEGRDVFRRSAGLVLLDAIADTFPAVVPCLDAPVETGQRISLTPPPGQTIPKMARQISAVFQRLVAERAPLHEELWTLEEARAELAERGWHDAAGALMGWREATVALVACGCTYALRTGPVVPHAGYLAGARLLYDSNGLMLSFGDALSRHVPCPPDDATDRGAALEREARTPRHGGPMVEAARAWRTALGVVDVGRYNEACVSGRLPELIRVAEGFHEKRLGRMADQIAERRKSLRVICIAGPSSSGKTTFIKRLTTQLEINGLRPVSISLDDYYLDRDATPKDERGEYDFEALEAIQLARLQSDLRRALAGEQVATPRYDFKRGLSVSGGPELLLSDDAILLIEGIHGLNPALLGEAVAPEARFRIFIHPATTLPIDRLSPVDPTDVRLLRRIVRDRHGRNLSAGENIRRWPAVRRGELLHIYPFLQNADEVFDSALIYEISVLKVYAERYLLEVPPGHPSMPAAHRLRNLMDRFVTIYPDHVPQTSVLREFIGGSGFEY